MLEIDLLVVKGKSEPHLGVDAAGRRARARRRRSSACSPTRTTDMLARYRAPRFRRRGGAARRLPAIRAGRSSIDALYDLYAERIAAFIAEPPPPRGGRAYTATSK